MGLFGPPNIDKMLDKNDVRGVIKALFYEKDSDVRRSAAIAFGQIGDSRTVKHLIAMLGNKIKEMRLVAAEALAKLYQSGQLDRENKQMILSKRHLIIQSHIDQRSGYGGSSDCHKDSFPHTDRGIGISFPN